MSSSAAFAGGLGPVPVLVDTAFDQRQDSTSQAVEPAGRRVPPIARQPGCHPQQGGGPVAYRDRAVRGEGEEGREATREGIGNDRGALDQPGIAMAGLGSGLATVEQQDAAAAFLQVQGDADADDAGAEHDHIRLSSCRRHRSPSHCLCSDQLSRADDMHPGPCRDGSLDHGGSDAPCRIDAPGAR